MSAASWPVACATGHRPQQLSYDAREYIREQLHQQTRRLRDNHGTRVAISGMALGVDTWWAQAALDAGLELWAYVPFPQQADRWPDAERAEWRRLLDRAARVRTFGDSYSVRLLHARNHGMLTDATAVVAVWAAHMQTGGTFAAVKEAHRRNLPGVWIDPRERTVVDRVPDPANPHNLLVITCGGRAVDDALIPIGEPCGAVYVRPTVVIGPGDILNEVGPAPDDVYLLRARAAGWAIAQLPSGVVAATCPRCRRPDPVTTAACRELAKSTIETEIAR